MTEEPPTPQRPDRVDDPGYDPTMQSAPQPAPPPLPPDDLVSQAVERAAEKVAAVTVPLGPPVMNRTEALIAVMVLLVLNAAALFVGLRTYNSTNGHRQDFKAVCQLIVERSPAESATELGRLLAECLR